MEKIQDLFESEIKSHKLKPYKNLFTLAFEQEANYGWGSSDSTTYQTMLMFKFVLEESDRDFTLRRDAAMNETLRKKELRAYNRRVKAEQTARERAEKLELYKKLKLEFEGEEIDRD